MSKYDKELDTRTDEYEKAIEPLERETKQKDDDRENEDRDAPARNAVSS